MAEPREAGRLAEHRWAANVASHLLEALVTGRGASVTWYNHASVLQSIGAEVDVARFDHVGLDGFFLRRLAASGAPRTSADLVLPLLLSSLPSGTRVALIGSSTASLASAREAVEALPSAPLVAFTCDGFGGLLPPAEMAVRLRALDVHLVVVGLGAPHQDTYVLGLAEHGLTSEVLLTAGGWLDQVGVAGYYPGWAYRLKLNWLVRVVREPGRLWRRYTVDALHAARSSHAVRTYLLGQGRRPFDAMVSASLSAAPTPADLVSAHPVAM